MNYFCWLAFIVILFGCRAAQTDDAEKNLQEVFIEQQQQDRLRLYTNYHAQKKRTNINGVFDIKGSQSQINEAFWRGSFDTLTSATFYGDFFLEFYDYMSYVAKDYPAKEQQKAEILQHLEQSFRDFCVKLKIAAEFAEFQRKQQLIVD